MKNINDTDLQEVVCRAMNFNMLMFSPDFYEKKFIYPIPVRHEFVVDMLTYFGVSLDEANKISEARVKDYVGREFWSSKDIITFVKEELLAQL